MESLKNWWKYSMGAVVIQLILGLTVLILVGMTCVYIINDYGEFLFGVK